MRNYKRKTNRKICTPEMFDVARQRLEQGISKRRIARDLGISESALRKRLIEGCGALKLGRFVSTFTAEQESQFIEYINEMIELFHGITFKVFRTLAFQYAKANNISLKFDNDNRTVGKDWALIFVKKQKLRLKRLEQTRLAKIMGFNKENVKTFQSQLSDLTNKHKFTPGRIFSVDEAVLSITSANCDEFITAVCGMSASGYYVPPVLVFKKNERNLNGDLSLNMFISDDGHINAEIFLKWLRHFHGCTAVSKTRPALLIVDDDPSHMSYEAIEYCRANGIHLIGIPPYSSDKMQPVDRFLFKSLREQFIDECYVSSENHTGTISPNQIEHIFRDVFDRFTSTEVAVNAFKICGIVPIDPEAFQESDFTVFDSAGPSSSKLEHFSSISDEIDDFSDGNGDDRIQCTKCRKKCNDTLFEDWICCKICNGYWHDACINVVDSACKNCLKSS